ARMRGEASCRPARSIARRGSGVGIAGYADELADAFDLSILGAVTTKSITKEPREGNPTWRIVPSKAGMLNAIGLANPGIDRFMDDIVPRLERVPTTVIGSVAGNAIENYAAVCQRMEPIAALPAVELNVSCPNVHGGTEFGVDPDALSDLVRACRAELTSTKLIVKLSPIAVGRPGIVEVATAAVEAGADALTVANTVPAMGIDVNTREPVLSNRTGGLSGPAVHPIAVKLVHDVYRALPDTPIIGLGGVMDWDDAAEFVLAGATAVGVGTALFANPRQPKRLLRQLSRWLDAQNAQSINDLLGVVELG
ncbi:MAG: dihydroorotate dehydrogenase, partial [Planctomycetota bacterium]